MKSLCFSPFRTAVAKGGFIIETALAVAFILFWLYTVQAKLSNFSEFKGEIHNQVFADGISNMLIYVLPAIEIAIAVLLVFYKTRFAGFMLSLALMLTFSIYVGLALLNVYSRMPCSCAGLFHFSWKAQLYFNLFVTAVAAAGSILTFKDRERRKQGMDAIVSHAPLTA